MTPEPEQLKALAEAAKGWNLNFVMNMTDEEPCEVGWKDEDGCFYPLITVDCENYFQPSGPLADYIAAANPERILALIAENERLQRIADDFQNRWNSERQINESQISGGRYPDGTPAW